MSRWVSHLNKNDFEAGWPFTRRRLDGGYDVRIFRSAVWDEGDREACRKGGPAICREGSYSKEDVADRLRYREAYARATAATRAVFLMQDGIGPRSRSCGRGSIRHTLPDVPARIDWPGGHGFEWHAVSQYIRELDSEFVGICQKLKQRWLP